MCHIPAIEDSRLFISNGQKNHFNGIFLIHPRISRLCENQEIKHLVLLVRGQVGGVM